MLKNAIFINIFVIFIMSIVFLIMACRKKTNLKILRKTIAIYIIFDLISYILCDSEIVEINWNFLIISPALLISFILYIIGLCCASRQSDSDVVSNNSFKKYIIIIIIPILIFIIPYLYELFVINTCDYLLKYNYQNGIVQSDDTYLAIINNKPVTITLQKNLFNRQGLSTNELKYDISYTNGVEISTRDSSFNKKNVENEDIKKISTDAKEKCPSAKGAIINYFPDGKCAIIELMSEETYGTRLGEYFYYNNTYIKDIQTHGSLVSIIYYSK